MREGRGRTGRFGDKTFGVKIPERKIKGGRDVRAETDKTKKIVPPPPCARYLEQIKGGCVHSRHCGGPALLEVGESEP